MRMIMLPSAENANTKISIPVDNIAWIEPSGRNTLVFLRQPTISPPIRFVIALSMEEVKQQIETGFYIWEALNGQKIEIPIT